MSDFLFNQMRRLEREHEWNEHVQPAAGCPLCPQRGVYRRRVMADVIRDWIHTTPLSQCNAGSDECPDWPMAFALADLINAQLEQSGRVVGVIPIQEGLDGDRAT
jgi:hypothetical protein